MDPLSLLLMVCMAHTTIIADNDARLLWDGEYQYGFTDDNGLFIAAAHEKDILLTTHECGHFVDFVLVNGKSKKTDANFEAPFRSVPKDDPSLKYYSISWKDYYTPKEKAKFSIPYAGSSPFEEFAVDFSDYVFNKKLDRAHQRQMRVMVGKAIRAAKLLK